MSDLGHLVVLFVILISGVSEVKAQCVPRNCVVQQWTPWTECTVTCGTAGGKRHRKRAVLLAETCGGTCPYTKNEEEVCNKVCCPKNCEYSQWGAWGNSQICEENCEKKGLTTSRYVYERWRHRTAFQKCGGSCDAVYSERVCGALCCYKSCVETQWSFWGLCDAPCEQTGIKKRTRSVEQEAMCGGPKCGKLEESAPCTGKVCPVDCIIGKWSLWSECSATCGKSTVERSRELIPAIGSGKPCPAIKSETKECEVYKNTDCEVTEWEAWTTCKPNVGKCGEGTKTRARKVSINKVCNGKECPPLSETHQCEGPCCKKDCKLSEWTQWGLCSSKCGDGTRQRTRLVKQPAACGGKVCETNLIEKISCSETVMHNCQFSPWGRWTECSNNCGEGTRKRFRTMITAPTCGGKCPDRTTENSEACTSYSAKKHCKDKRSCPTCEQKCKDGVCSCNPGFKLNSDQRKCDQIYCSVKINDIKCPAGRTKHFDCFDVKYGCFTSSTYNSECKPKSCVGSDTLMQGDCKPLICQADGTWSSNGCHCIPNKPPVEIVLGPDGFVEENAAAKSCPWYFKTKTNTVQDAQNIYKYTYSLITNPGERFFVKEKEGKLCLNIVPDYELIPNRWTIKVRSTNRGGLFVEAEFKLTVKNKNEAPKDVKLTPDTIPENCPKGRVVGVLSAKDDEGDKITFQLLDSDMGLFEGFKNEDGAYGIRVALASNALCAHIGGAYCYINYEWKNKVRITVKVMDDKGASSLIDMFIKISDRNDGPTNIWLETDKSLKLKYGYLPEAVPVGTPLATLKTVDEDYKHQTHAYELFTDAGGLFKIEGDKLFGTKVFDYESNIHQHYEIKVQTTDNGSPVMPFTKELSIKIADLNESPYDLILKSTNGVEEFDTDMPKVVEHVPIDTVIGTFTVKDHDDSDQLTFTMTPASSVLSLSTPTFKVTDKGAKFVEKTFNISVKDINEPATDILVNDKAVKTLEVPENANGYELGALKAVDPDIGSEYHFVLSDNAGGRFSISGNKLLTSSQANIDYELLTNHNIKIIAMDRKNMGSLFFVKGFTIVVKDVNEKPTKLIWTKNELNENSVDGSEVATYSTVDPDNINSNLQNFTYSILSGGESVFKISANKLIVTSPKTCTATDTKTCSLNFEKKNSYSLEIGVMDSGEPTQTSTFPMTVKLIDVNDAPRKLTLSSMDIFENEPADSEIGRLTAFEEDAAQILTYRVISGDQFVKLVDKNRVVAMKTFNFEELQSFEVEFEASDNDIRPASTTAKVTITVKDINEKPVCVTLDDVLVDEDADVGRTLAQIKVKDQDNNEQITFKEENHPDQFDIVDSTNEVADPNPKTHVANLKLKAKLDYEKRASYDISIRATDKKGLHCLLRAQVIVNDKNDEPTDIAIDGRSSTILRYPENLKKHEPMKLSTTDQDNSDKHTYSLVPSPFSDLFAISGESFKFADNVMLDYEKLAKFNFKLKTVDSGTPPKSFIKEFTIEIININDPPSSISISQDKIKENSAVDEVVGKLSATDPDSTVFKYSLVDSANGRFKIGAGDNVLVNGFLYEILQFKVAMNNGLDFEISKKHVLKVRVEDNGSPPMSIIEDIIIHVENVNEPPYNIQLDSLSVRDTVAKGFIIGTLSVSDDDINQEHTFTLTNDFNGEFKLEGKKLTKATDTKLDIKSHPKIVVAVEDNGTPPLKVSKELSLLVVKDDSFIKSIALTSKSSQLTFVDDKAKVPENTAVNSVIGTIEAKTDSAETGIRCSLLDSDNPGIFKIGNVTTQADNAAKEAITKAEIILGMLLDFEKEQTYQIGVKITSHNGLREGIGVFKIAVTNENEPPKDILFSDAELKVLENMDDKTIGKFDTKDPDVGDKHTYTLKESAGGKFVISSTGILKTAVDANIDFETTATLTVTIESTDSGNLKYEKQFTVTIIDVNEAPSQLSIDNNTIAENSPADTGIGKLTAKDPDNEKAEIQKHTFELVDSAGGRFKLTENILKVVSASLLNYEDKSAHPILVKVTDDGKPTPASKEFPLVISLTDVNEPPTNVKLDNDRVSENEKVGFAIGEISAEDEDKNQFFAITMVSSSGGIFGLQDNKLVLLRKLDFEVAKRHEIKINIFDSGNSPVKVSKTFVITVLDDNDPPQSIEVTAKVTANQGLNGIKVLENTPSTTELGEISGIDPDNNDALTFQLGSNDVKLGQVTCSTKVKGFKKFTECKAKILLNVEPNYETKKKYNIPVTVVDKLGKTLTSPFIIEVMDSNDPPVNILVDGQDKTDISTVENLPVNKVIATFKAVDEDVEQKHTFSLKTANVPFEIVGNKLQVANGKNIDFESKSMFELTVTVSDGKSSVDKRFTVNVVNQNEVPIGISISTNLISEAATPETVIGTISTDDPDNKNANIQTFTYSLSDSANGLFYIDGHLLKTGKTAKLNHEQFPQYKIKVSVVDSGSPPKEAEFELLIQVTDANDAPTNIALNGDSVKEDAPLGTEIGLLSASDEDQGQILRFVIGGSNSLVSSGNKLIVDGPLDFESQSKIEIIVRAFDNGSPSLSVEKTFTITVLDTNEPIQSIKAGLPINQYIDLYVYESQPVGTLIGDVRIFDPDLNEKINVEIIQDGNGLIKLGSQSCTAISEKNAKTRCITSLLMAKTANFEEVKDKTMNIEISATDNSKNNLREIFIFRIANVNEAPTDIRIDGDGSFDEYKGVDPSTPSLIFIGALSTVDQDKNDEHVYYLLDHYDKFVVKSKNRLHLQHARNTEIDYEKTPIFPLKIRTEDNGSPKLGFTKILNLKVNNVNEKPEKPNLSNTEMSEVAKSGHLVGLLEVTDPDNLGTNGKIQEHKCQVLSSSNIFTIDQARLALKLSSDLTQNVKSYNVSITCTDTGKPPLTSDPGEFEILVKSSPNIPKAISVRDLKSVDENVADLTVASFAVINDITGSELEGAFTYDIKNPDVPFVIKNNLLITKTGVDFEMKPLWKLTVTVKGESAKNGPVDEDVEIKVNVVDKNEEPTLINFLGEIDENSPTDSLVGVLSTDDPDGTQTHVYTLINTASGELVTELKNVFKIDGNKVIVGTPGDFLDHEKHPYFSLDIKAEDNGVPPLSITKTVYVSVKNVNEAPSIVRPTTFQVKEDEAIGKEIGTIKATDPDSKKPANVIGNGDFMDLINGKGGLPGGIGAVGGGLPGGISQIVTNSAQCYIVTSPETINLPFKLDKTTNIITLGSNVDYEKTKSYVFEVTCEDSLRLKDTKMITIDVIDVNEPPYNIRLNKRSVAEDKQVGENIAEIDVTDPDSTKVTYEVTSEDGYFALEGTDTIVLKKPLNFEVAKFHDLKIKCKDDGGLSTETTIKILVTDSNDKPSDIQLDKLEVPENADTGTVVGNLNVIDEDVGQSHSCDVVQSDALKSPFRVVGSQLLVNTKANGIVLDFESDPEYPTKIKCSDNRKPVKSIEKDFKIVLTDVEEPPKNLTIRLPKDIPETAAAGFQIATITVHDEDKNDKVQCSVKPVTTFALEDVTASMTTYNLKLATGALVNYEEKKKYRVTVTCSDGKLQTEKSVVIEVLDVNETPTEIKLTGDHTIPSSAKIGKVVGVLKTSDPDNGQEFTYNIKGPGNGIFEIDNDVDILKMKSEIPATILELASPKIDVEIESTDNGIPRKSITKTIQLTVKMEPSGPPTILITNKLVDDKAPVDTVIGTLELVNPPGGKASNYKLAVVENEYVKLGENNALVLKKAADYGVAAVYKVTVQALRVSDNNKLIGKNFMIIVNQADQCAKNTHACHEDAVCRQNNATHYDCTCKSGMTGNGFLCNEIDDCKYETVDNKLVQRGGNPCKHDGKCEDGQNKFSCVCTRGYAGKYCEIDTQTLDPCKTMNCTNGADCLKTNGTAQCICHDGWTGERCEVSVDDCVDVVCLGGGTCVDQHQAYVCNCAATRFGIRCEKYKSACSEASACDSQHFCAPKYNEIGHYCFDASAAQLDIAVKNFESSKQLREELASFCEMKNDALTKLLQAAEPGTTGSKIVCHVIDVEVNDSRRGSLSMAAYNDKGEVFSKASVLKIFGELCAVNLEGGLKSELCKAFVKAYLDSKSSPGPKSDAVAKIGGGRIMFLVVLIAVYIIR
ncbi:protocadherin Fat 4-like [Tubulanus polymorphus]|uniref:protocadherin Fat 4-like n=1 Tax=Tubulanus polymorphus TaxID=672921 RepID=UPI003DA4089E